MHNLALELQRIGHRVTGSDDEIFEPSKSRLANAELHPETLGWYRDNITPDIDRIILGMHAREDNPELLRAQELGLVIQSFPEFVYEQSVNKKRVVVAGSHGKTSTTAMIMHVLRKQGVDFDYLVGSKLEGFELMVRLSDAPLIILEGDEYLSSPIDRKPKFLWYKPDIAIITGVAWDHINVFPTFEMYVDQFRLFAHTIKSDGSLIYYENDKELAAIAPDVNQTRVIPYGGVNHQVHDGQPIVEHDSHTYNMQVFGQHNFENIHAAILACKELGISLDDSLRALTSFQGTAKRLEKVHESDNLLIYRDFAHSPSKVKATVNAVKSTYPDHHVVAVLELHTFSSLTKDFLPLYHQSMDAADRAFVHFNTHVFELKRMEVLSDDVVQKEFGNVEVETDVDKLWTRLQHEKRGNTVFLMMSSGSFAGKDIQSLV